MPADRRRRLVDLVHGEVLRRTLVRRAHLLEKFVSCGSKRVAAFGDLRQVDVGVEVVEDIKIRFRGAGRRIYAEKVNGVGGDP